MGRKVAIQARQVPVPYAPVAHVWRDATPHAQGTMRILFVSAQPNFWGLRQRPALASRTESVHAPDVLRFVMPQHKVIAVLCANTKVNRSRRIPLIIDFCDFEYAPAQSESNGTLVGSIPGIALDVHFAHRCLP